jgi:hypothetical protein
MAPVSSYWFRIGSVVGNPQHQSLEDTFLVVMPLEVYQPILHQEFAQQD